jgi:hypothetical protein
MNLLLWDFEDFIENGVKKIKIRRNERISEPEAEMLIMSYISDF